MHPSIAVTHLLRLALVAACCALLVLAGPAAHAKPGNGQGNAPAEAPGQAKQDEAPAAEQSQDAPGQAKKDEAPAPAQPSPAQEAPGQAKQDAVPGQSKQDAAPGQSATPSASPSPSPAPQANAPAARANAARPAGPSAPATRSASPAQPQTPERGAVAAPASRTNPVTPAVKSLLAGTEGGSAQVGATFACLSVTVSSTKDLSNVVLVFADGSTQKFDGLSGHSGTFSGIGEHAGKEIVAVYVKSGNNSSGDGPGYGERIDSDADCAAAADAVLVDPALVDPALADPVQVGASTGATTPPADAALPAMLPYVDASSTTVTQPPAPVQAAPAGAQPAEQPAVAVLGAQATAAASAPASAPASTVPDDTVVVAAGAPSGTVVAQPASPTQGALAATGAGVVVQLLAGLLLIAGGAGLRRRSARR